MSGAAASNVYQFSAKTIDGSAKKLADYSGKVVLIVNVASKCGLTPQYKGLEELQRQYAERGFRVLGFPANEFGAQEPGTNEEIHAFCSTNYGVSFDMFAKMKVKGDGADPLFRFLADEAGGEPKWNFTKFLIGKKGEVLARFEPTVEPTGPEIKAAIEKAL